MTALNIAVNVRDKLIRSRALILARVNPHFNNEPFRAELFYDKSGWSGVMNLNNINCLSFKSYPGITITDFETAKLIAKIWNNSYSKDCI
jgi:hypothetical protein